MVQKTQSFAKCTVEHFVVFFAENFHMVLIWQKKSIGDNSFSILPPPSNLMTPKTPVMPFLNTFLTTQISDLRNASVNPIS